MNPRITLAIIAAGMAGIIGIIAFSGSQLINDVTEEGLGTIPSSPITVIPLEPQLEKIQVLSVNEEEATIKITFKITNPNYKSALLHVVKYHLYADDKRIATEEIGDRAEGMVTGSNYFTILRDSPQILDDTIILKNMGGDPQFWSSLSAGNVKWRVDGELYFNLSSMTSGHENIVPFEFTY
ncbi:MAG: hypothetical protein QXE84_00855 [Candidatus Nitrosotenuis sp.]|uniref:Water stress and hypersensitive response domain-containing protein n=1 Tax=Candidatus Nitrosotenuis uzonensis TaxID=1407055 RepID=A0A812EVL9_9ARCH|nr:hypothetical protein [Candidatus Nitrosotenuis uzonensis]CAE6489974.1 conserved hypothetical protein [Candidatus Nitrosotenuis uzonensis]